MTILRWLSLKPGDYVRSRRSGVLRRVISSSPGGIQLQKMRLPTRIGSAALNEWRISWTPLTTYVKGDRYLFDEVQR